MWGDEESQGEDPPRLWVQNGMYTATAFVRSVGDSTAKSIGILAIPEAARFTDPHDTCAAIAGESYKLLLEHENQTDDTTIIIVHIKDLSHSGAGTTDRNAAGTRNPPSSKTEKGMSDISITSGLGISDSIKSGLSDVQLSMNRNPASVVPSPISA